MTIFIPWTDSFWIIHKKRVKKGLDNVSSALLAYQTRRHYFHRFEKVIRSLVVAFMEVNIVIMRNTNGAKMQLYSAMIKR